MSSYGRSISENRRASIKLPPVASGPYRVFEVQEDTNVISDGDEKEKVSRDRM